MKSPCPELSYYGRRENFDFWFTPGCPVIPAAMEATLAGKADAQNLLKRDKKRLLFIGNGQNQTRFVVKINLLPRCKDRFRARHFAPQECQCHMQIAKSGIPVPALWGYFRQTRLGITLCNGLILEFLEGARNLGIGDSQAAIPLLVALHEKGINHPDFMRNNIMLSPNDKGPILIDLELCSFVAPGDMRLPLMNLARFIEYNETPFDDSQNQSLIRQTYNALHSPVITLECFQELLAMLNMRHLTTRERVGLHVPADVLKKLHQACKP